MVNGNACVVAEIFRDQSDHRGGLRESFSERKPNESSLQSISFLLAKQTAARRKMNKTASRRPESCLSDLLHMD